MGKTNVATRAWLGNFVSTATWKARLDAWLTAKGRGQHPFVSANHLAISRGLTHKESGLRMVVNIPAEALLAFVKDGEYGNVYAEPIIAGKKRTASAARIKVDALLGFGEKAPHLLLRCGGDGRHRCPVLRRVLHGAQARSRRRQHADFRSELLRPAVP